MLIALALIFARLFGYFFSRFQLPAVIGEILAGVFLGWISIVVFTGQTFTIFGLTLTFPALDYLSLEFDFLADIGILFLLFISGLSTSLRQLKSMGKTSVYVAIGGIIAPLFFGYLAGISFGFTSMDSIIIGLILIATSVGVTVRTLLDMDMLDTNVGSTILGAAVIDDVLGVVLLAFFIGADPILYVGLKVVLFFLIFLYLGLRIIDHVLDLGEKIHLPKAFLSIALAIFLLFSYFADACGISGIIGAFIAGLLIGHSLKSRKIVDDVQTIGYGFFVPLFFIWVGARLYLGVQKDVNAFLAIGFFALILIIVALLGKIIGCGIGSKLAGLSTKSSLQIGIGMMPRMELALIIVSAAISKNIFSTSIVAHQILAVTVFLTISTTLITPILIKLVFNNK
ncbi:MAG: cation:proton antiporter [Thermoplasmatota archaeon]